MFQNFEVTSEKSETPARLAKLRELLEAKGFDAFLVPRADAHQGEMVPPRDARLGWITGFTGSAGIAVISKAKAWLFVDGRYTLQAREQVDLSLFEILPLHQKPLSEFLAETMPPNSVIAYDPWLHGHDEIDRIETAIAEGEIRLSPSGENPIDRIWEDQPPPPGGAVTVHPGDLAGEASASKRARLAGEMEEDAAFLSLPDSIAWLLNIRGSDLSHSPVALGFAVLHKDGTTDLVMDPDKFDGTVRSHLGDEIRVRAPGELDTVLAELAGKAVLLDRRTCPVRIAQTLEDAGAEIVWGRDPCIHPKAAKTSAELDGIRASHRRDGVAMVRFLCWLDGQVGAGPLTEIDLVKKLEAIRAEAGIVDISFDTICGSGPNGAIVHYRVDRKTNRQISPGETVLIDSGGQYPDGTTDITRTVPFGPPDAEVVKPFTLVLRGMIALSMARWPAGLAGRDLDPIARMPLWMSGYDYDHGTGHGVGAYLNVHEGPASISRRGEVALVPGMVLSNEPGYYRTEGFGIRTENLVIVEPAETPEGGDRAMLSFETLTLCPIDRRLIDISLMTAAEIVWLDAYHARVLDCLAPDLSPEETAWLTGMCAPLGGA